MLIRNCPPISARKRFRLEKIIKSPETEWQKAHGNVNASGDGEGELRSTPDVPEMGGVLEEVRRVTQKSPSNVAEVLYVGRPLDSKGGLSPTSLSQIRQRNKVVRIR